MIMAGKISNDSQSKRTCLSRRIWLLIALLTISVLGPTSVAEKRRESETTEELRPIVSWSMTQPRPAQQTKTAEQVYKNIQVFKTIPAAELEPTMAFISGSLGVK